MAQQKPDEWVDEPLDQWQDITPDEWIDEEPAGKSLKDYGWEMGISTVPAVIGDFFGPVGSIVGGGIGELGRQIYTGDFNPALIGTEAFLNVVPGLGKAERSLFGAVKHGVKSGAFQGLVGATPRHIAETGRWELPGLEETAIQTGFGGLFGGGTGGVMHGLGKIGKTQAGIEPLPPDLKQPMLPGTEIGPPPTPPPTGPQFPTGPVPMTPEAPRPTKETPLPFGPPPKPPGPQFPTEPLPLEYPVRPEEPPAAGGGGDVVTVGDDGIVTISGKNIDAINNLKRKGFVILQGSATPDGKIKMKLERPDQFSVDEPQKISRPLWSDRPPRVPLHGDEEIPDLSYQADEGVVSHREWMESPSEELTGQISKAQEATNKITETEPEYILSDITENHPNILEEAHSIYNETDPRQMVRNLADTSARRDEAWRKWNQAQRDRNEKDIPVPKDITDLYYRLERLRDLAQAKYERASYRGLQGEPMFSRRPPGEPPEFGEPGREPLPGEQTGRVAPFDPNYVPVGQRTPEGAWNPQTGEMVPPVQGNDWSQHPVYGPEPFGPPVKGGYPDEIIPGVDQPVPPTMGQQELPMLRGMGDRLTQPFDYPRFGDNIGGEPVGGRPIDLGPTPKMEDFRQPKLPFGEPPQHQQLPGQPPSTSTPEQRRQYYADLEPAIGNEHVVDDPTGRYTPEELYQVQHNPMLKSLAGVMKRLLDDLHAHFSPQELMGRTVKYGFRLDDFGEGGMSTTSQNAAPPNLQIATLINPVDVFATAYQGAPNLLTPAQAARRFVHQVKHEFGHNLAREEGSGFTWAFSHIDTRFERTDEYVAEVLKLISSPTGNYVKEVPNFLQQYLTARRRPGTKVDIFARPPESSALGQGGPARISRGGGPYGAGTTGGRGGAVKPPAQTPPKPLKPPETSVMRELYNLARGITTSLDISAPLRQGLPLMTTKEWWKSWGAMVNAWGSEKSYEAVNKSIEMMDLFRPRIDLKTGRTLRSIADESGIRLSDLKHGLMGREESVMSTWAETGQFFGLGKETTAGSLWKKSVGRGVRASNRAYTAYLNKLRADTFKSLMEDAQKAAIGDAKMDPFQNKELAREIGEFVMTATGRGPLKTELPHLYRDAQNKLKVGLKTRSLEQNAQLLTHTMFSPRLMASRVRMLNPATYAMASPYVRKQYLKSLLTVTGFGLTMNGVASMFGAETNLTDPTTSDWGKLKFGPTRVDPWGGFQQFGVAGWRLLTGRYTSSGTSEEFELGRGYRAPTRGDVLEQFASNKLHPMLKFGYDMLTASEYKSFRVGDRIAQMYVPLIAQDAFELITEDPGLAPLVLPLVAAGMGTQTYEGGQSERGLIPQELDFTWTGGAPENELDYLIPDELLPPQ